MNKPYLFKIPFASAKIEDGGITVKLYYPDHPEMIEGPLPENLEFGIKVFDSMIERGYSAIATHENPIRPASAGGVYVFKDGKFVCSRIDRHAPKDRCNVLYHTAYGAYPQSKEAVSTEEGLRETGLWAMAKEILLITREKPHRLIVPNNSRTITEESAKRVGIDLDEIKPLYKDVITIDPPDKIEVYDPERNLLFSHPSFMEFAFKRSMCLNALQLYKVPLSSEEILPIDIEGMMKDGSFHHFNREAYIMPLDVSYIPYGSIIENPKVYQTRFEKGIPIVFEPEYEEPYLGPDEVEVIHPHVWSPGNMLARLLDPLSGKRNIKWMHVERRKEKKKRDGKSLLPENVLVA